MPAAIEEAVRARPAGPLNGAVARYLGYRQRNIAPGRFLGLPSPYLTVIFTLDEPMRIAQQVDPSRPPAAYLALVGGLHTRPAVLEHDGAQSGIQLLTSPLASRAMFGVPAGELAHLDVAATDLLGRFGADLHERLRDTTTWTERFTLLDEDLGRALNAEQTPPPELCHAWRLLRATHGTARIADIAPEVGWSERHLADRFRVEIGLPPKVAARVIRFDRARRMVAHDRVARFAEVAARCGYADQSHLVRDIVAFTGMSPSAYRAQVGNIQARPADRGPHSAHDNGTRSSGLAHAAS